MAATAAQLSTLLGAEPPASIGALPEDVRADLAMLLAAARRRQAADLQAAFSSAVRHVPFPVRGLVKKMLL